jgi:glycosyltransferase involved in cell wall biosynthesis
MPKLSIITTVYNVEEYLRPSLESVFAQTFSDFELILVNDGSTDHTRDILLEYMERPNVRLLENRYNEGIPVSRNRALLAASGEYVAIHDGDDISLDHRFEKEVAFLDENPDIGFMGGHAIKISAAGEKIGSMHYPPATTPEAFMIVTRYKLNPIIDPSCMYRRQLILDNGGYSMDPEIRTALDFHLWCRLLCKGVKLANLQEPLIKYRINPKGVTRTENDTMVQTTDLIWATFRRKRFPNQVLDASLFEQDSYTEYVKDHMET